MSSITATHATRSLVPKTQSLHLNPAAAAWRRVGDQIVVLDQVASEFLAVNASGAQLWDLIAEGATHAQLVSALQHAFGLSAAAARGDVDRFLDSLRASGLLETAE